MTQIFVDSMHVKSSSQNKFLMSLGIHRNKLHSKPLLQPPPVTSPVTLDQRADGPQPTVGQSASRGLQHRASAQKHVPRICMADNLLSTLVRSAIQFKIPHRTESFLELIPSLYGGRSAPLDQTVRGYCLGTDWLVCSYNRTGCMLSIANPASQLFLSFG